MDFLPNPDDAVPADLAVEVLSPNDPVWDAKIKTEEYFSAGFPLVWEGEPATRTGMIHRADGSVTKLHKKDEITGESAIPSFHCRVADLFAATA